MSPMNVPSLGRGATVSTQHVGSGEPLNSGHADLEVGHDVGEVDVEERFVEGGDEGARVAANMIVSNLFSAGCAGAEVRAEGDAAMKPLYVG